MADPHPVLAASAPDLDPDALDAVRALVAAAERPVVLSGAGMSAESGIPTFRDAQTGLWERFSAEQLATEEAFLADPALVWSSSRPAACAGPSPAPPERACRRRRPTSPDPTLWFGGDIRRYSDGITPQTAPKRRGATTRAACLGWGHGRSAPRPRRLRPRPRP